MLKNVCLWCCLLFLVEGLLPVRAQSPGRAADVPQPIPEVSWLRRVGEQQQQLSNQPCRVCFIGDSLTEFWTQTGKATWQREFGPLKPLNLGITADRTEHVLNRIQRLDFRRARPEAVVLLMGTNNMGMEPPDAPQSVVRAIQKGVLALRAKLPGVQVLVLGLPPSGIEARSALRQRIQSTNALLAAASWPEGVSYLPTYAALVDEQDLWKLALTVDGTHFSATGYEELARLIGPVLHKTLKPL